MALHKKYTKNMVLSRIENFQMNFATNVKNCNFGDFERRIYSVNMSQYLKAETWPACVGRLSISLINKYFYCVVKI
jgi:hypothetical protein